MTTLECATAGCSECRETVKEAHHFRSYDSPPIRLHEPPAHEKDPEYEAWLADQEGIEGTPEYEAHLSRERERSQLRLAVQEVDDDIAY